MAERNETQGAPVDAAPPTPAANEEADGPEMRKRKHAEMEQPEASASHAEASPDSAEAPQTPDDQLQQQLAAEQAKSEELSARLQRVQADFANYKRRSEQEREGQARFATLLLVTELLPILDNFDRALATMPEEVRSLPWTEGLLLVDRQLRSTLEKQGLKPIEAVGSRFDPTLHEAIIHEESADHEDDEVIAELQRGYMLHDKVIRPTLVKVAKR